MKKANRRAATLARKQRRQPQASDMSAGASALAARAENRDSCDMREVGLEFDFQGPEARPGDYCFRTTESAAGQTYLLLWHILPDGSVGAIPIEPIPQAARPTWTHGDPPKCHTWEWDGNRERPTLKPCVHARGLWHGLFRAGRMVSC